MLQKINGLDMFIFQALKSIEIWRETNYNLDSQIESVKKTIGEYKMLKKISYMTAGESHGKGLIGIIEGIPAGLQLTEEYIAVDF